MNKHYKKTRKSVLDHEERVMRNKESKNELENRYKSGSVAKNDYVEKMKVLNQPDKTVHDELNSIVESYQSELNDWAILKGEDLTKDIEILKSPINLTKEEYEQLENKYQTNYSMLKAIKDHAKSNDISYNEGYLVDKERKLDYFKRFVDEAKNIVYTVERNDLNLQGALWKDETKFNDIYSGHAKLTQTIERSNK